MDSTGMETAGSICPDLARASHSKAHPSRFANAAKKGEKKNKPEETEESTPFCGKNPGKAVR